MKILGLLLSLIVTLAFAGPGSAQSLLEEFLPQQTASELMPGADGFGAIRPDLPVAPVLDGGETVAWAFVTSDFVGTTGYSGKPIHSMVVVDNDAKVVSVRLLKHSEPIVLIGIPEAKVRALVEGYAGLDLVAAARSGGTSHELDIISGATVTVMVIDDSIVRSGLRVARDLGLGGLAPDVEAGPQFVLNPDAEPATSWTEMEGDGTVRRLVLSVGEVNEAFATHPDDRAATRPLAEPPETTFIDMAATLVSVPQIGSALLNEGDFRNLQAQLGEGQHAIAVMGQGLYSFKGSGYVRGGIFDRIVLIQDDISVRFRDRDHVRLNGIAPEDAPDYNETDLFRIPADSGFDPTRPFRIQLLVQRAVGPVERVYQAFDLGYQVPNRYLTQVEQPAPPPEAAAPADTAAPVAAAVADRTEAQGQAALWQRIWDAKQVEIAILIGMLAVLTGAFFFMGQVTRNERHFYIFRMAFLTVTLVWLGWYAQAQLSVLNVLALFNSLMTGFSWQAFLLDPLVFILWFAVAAALIFWGRGAYCGWLCPFGALQELTNQIGRKLGIPQWTVPWALHERLWPVKYIIFLGLFGVSLAGVEQAERLAEVEPFKTAIILNFVRAWPFVAYAVALLVAGLFVERFFCRYMCPLGAALAIPARIRMFDWLKRYKECGNPCQTCANECPVQSIHPTGEINPNECIDCLHCQVLYRSETKCPVVIKKIKRRDALAASTPPILGKPPAGHPNAARTSNA